MKNGFVFCSECGEEVEKRETCIIDDRPVCHTCLYNGLKPVEIYPVGTVRTSLLPDELGGLPTVQGSISSVDLLPSQKRFMYRLEEEEYITVVYYLHKVTSVKTVFNRRLDGKRVGVFASRTPHRTSMIAIQDVKLLEIKGTSLYVEGLDAMDESPVLDIKIKISALDLPPKK